MRVLRSLAVLCLLTAALLAVILALGSWIPRSHTVSASVVVAAPRGQVWQLLEDIPAQPKWRTEVVAIEPRTAEGGHPCWTEIQKYNRVPLCEDVTAPPTTRVVRIADPRLPYSGTWTYDLQPIDANSTRVTITEQGTTGPAIWRFAGHYIYHEDTSIKQFESELQQAAPVATSAAAQQAAR